MQKRRYTPRQNTNAAHAPTDLKIDGYWSVGGVWGCLLEGGGGQERHLQKSSNRRQTLFPRKETFEKAARQRIPRGDLSNTNNFLPKIQRVNFRKERMRETTKGDWTSNNVPQRTKT